MGCGCLQIFQSGILMAPVHTKLRARTVTCTLYQRLCLETHSGKTPTSWFFVRFSNTTGNLQVYIYDEIVAGKLPVVFNEVFELWL